MTSNDQSKQRSMVSPPGQIGVLFDHLNNHIATVHICQRAGMCAYVDVCMYVCVCMRVSVCVSACVCVFVQGCVCMISACQVGTHRTFLPSVFILWQRRALSARSVALDALFRPPYHGSSGKDNNQVILPRQPLQRKFTINSSEGRLSL